MAEMTEGTRPLSGRVALVTGAGRGLGQAIATLLAHRGATVLATARSADQLDQTVRRIERSGGRALALPGDLGVLEEVDDLAQRAIGRGRPRRRAGQQRGDRRPPRPHGRP